MNKTDLTAELLGFGRGARTSTAKVGKEIDFSPPKRLVGFESGARIVTAKVGKDIPSEA